MAYYPIIEIPNAEQKARQFNRMNTIPLPAWSSLGPTPPIYENCLHLLSVRPAHWHSMWSHRRNQAWKGFVQIDLAATDDKMAIAQLDHLARQGVAA